MKIIKAPHYHFTTRDPLSTYINHNNWIEGSLKECLHNQQTVPSKVLCSDKIAQCKPPRTQEFWKKRLRFLEATAERLKRAVDFKALHFKRNKAFFEALLLRRLHYWLPSQRPTDNYIITSSACMKGHLTRRPSLRPVGRSAGGDSLQRRPLPPRFLPASLICKPHTEQTGCDSTGTTKADNIVLKHVHMSLLLQLLLLLLLLCHADTKASSSRFWGQRLQALAGCERPLSYILRSSKMNIRDMQSSSAGNNVSLTKPSLLNCTRRQPLRIVEHLKEKQLIWGQGFWNFMQLQLLQVLL